MLTPCIRFSVAFSTAYNQSCFGTSPKENTCVSVSRGRMRSLKAVAGLLDGEYSYKLFPPPSLELITYVQRRRTKGVVKVQT